MPFSKYRPYCGSVAVMTILAIIDGQARRTHAVLAAEALRKAASNRNRSIEIDLRVVGSASPEPDTRMISTLLLVGEGESDSTYLDIADKLSGFPKHTTTLDTILADADLVLDNIGDVQSSPSASLDGKPAKGGRIVAITSCPTGIAHTFMAAEGLQQGAAAHGCMIRVETQGSVGARDALSAEEIASADLVIIAADTQVDLSRFTGKRLFKTGTKAAIRDGAALITEAFAQASLWGQDNREQAAPSTSDRSKDNATPPRTGPYKHLMTGVSFMLPVVVAGGILIAMAFALGGVNVTDASQAGTLAHALFLIGAKSAFPLIVPVLAGYIAYSVADRPGIAPGLTGGMIASSMGAGFLGGILAGFIAGYSTAFFNRWIKLGRNLDGLKPVLILPVLGSLVTGLAMMYGVGDPAAHLLSALTHWLQTLQGSSAILLGLLLGGMMAIDMGGPINKAAYTFSVGLLASGIYTPMAAVVIAGMTPPLGMALATRLYPNRFTTQEREAGKAASILGLAFITEGVIPFAAADPLRVLPATAGGAAIAGAISMACDVQMRVPHGGVFVLPIPNAISHPLWYLAALAVGTIITAVLAGLLKKKRPTEAVL
ncbi:PTS system, fructose-specific IIBC component [Granulibacter bethesdensis CGDNIH4]|nr:PTS system, fructose-specific IIBC component [Granulibacter bethesdensis CGDNIH4]